MIVPKPSPEHQVTSGFQRRVCTLPRRPLVVGGCYWKEAVVFFIILQRDAVTIGGKAIIRLFTVIQLHYGLCICV